MYGFGSFYPNLFILLLIFYIILKNSTSNEFKVYYPICTFLILLAGFRSDTVGGDLENYIPHFEAMCRTNISDFSEVISMQYEPGYALIVKLISLISHNSQVFIFVTAILSLIGPFFLFKKYSRSIWLTLFFYLFWGLYTNTFNNIRQSIALSIVFFAIPLIFEKRLLRFIITILIATSCHYSAIFFLIAYPLSYIRLNIKTSTLYLTGGIVVVSTFGTILLNLLSQVLFVKYESVDFDNTGKGWGMFALYILLSIFALILFQIVKRNSNILISRSTSFFVLCMYTAAIIQYLAVFFPSMLRLTYYFFIPAIIGLSNLIDTIRPKPLSRFMKFILLLFVIYYCCRYIYAYSPDTMSNFQGVIPYSFM